MGFFGFVRQAKEQAAKKIDDFQRQRTVNQAHKLQGLRDERIKQEGRANIVNKLNEEKARIAKARLEQRQGSPAGQFLSKLKQEQQSRKKKTGRARIENLGKVSFGTPAFGNNAFGGNK